MVRLKINPKMITREVMISGPATLTRKYLAKELEQIFACNKTEITYYLLGKPYRRYRRGKNRCTLCGLKHKREEIKI